MLIGASQFGATAFSSPQDEGADPRRFISAIFEAGGGLSPNLSPESAQAVVMYLGGELDAPFVRIRRSGVTMHGIFGQGAEVAVSPVMITLDGGGGLTIAANYEPGRVRGVLSAGGGISARVAASLLAQASMAPGGGMAAVLSEYQKVRARLAAGGGLSPVVSRKQHIAGVFAADGGVRISPWYDLIGEVDIVVSRQAVEVLVLSTGSQIDYVSATATEDIIVLEVGI